jgi:hypothetical protein
VLDHAGEFGPMSARHEFERYSNNVAKALSTAIVATREPETEARVYCRDADELVLCLDSVRNACDALGTINWGKSAAEVKRTGNIVLELKNGSAIVLFIEREGLASATG